MTLSALGPSHLASTHRNEGCADTAERGLLGKAGGDEKHAASRNEEIAAAFCILQTWHCDYPRGWRLSGARFVRPLEGVVKPEPTG